jgi:hypothetical protein
MLLLATPHLTTTRYIKAVCVKPCLLKTAQIQVDKENSKNASTSGPSKFRTGKYLIICVSKYFSSFSVRYKPTAERRETKEPVFTIC